jgi:dTDP-4-amino-4,6-dideoxygalactose transaminase
LKNIPPPLKVTKSFLPTQDEYQQYLSKVWGTNWLTNDGELLKSLKFRLEEFLGVQNLDLLSNGTIALQLAIKALELDGEIITTPFSYVATTSSIVWENCKPIFCDIDKDTLNVDVEKIEEKVTSNTTALLFTHVYGNPCNVEEIERIARKYDLKVIYDAAHCFGVKYKDKSLYNYGDIATTSFHATKIFHTVEGGATITQSNELSYRIKQLRNFGHKGYEGFDGVGINGKQSEFHAAMGHCVLDHFHEIYEGRKVATLYYNDNLKWKYFRKPVLTKDTIQNYSYYPIILPSENETLELKNILENEGIYPRRYFYPSLTSLHYVDYDQACPVSDSISKKVLCLPLFHDINQEELDRVIFVINNFFKE